ncbi:MAG: alginate export family protein [Acidobacteriota bacterium]
MRFRKRTGWTAAAFLGWALGSLAQGLPLWEGPGERLRFLLEERGRWEAREDADFRKDRDDPNNFVGNRLRLGLEFRVGDALKVVAEGQDSRQWGADQEAAKIPGRYDDLRQAYAEVQIPVGRPRLGLKLGRQELAYGEERLVGAFGWSNVGRTFDALKARLAGEGYWAEAFVARARRRPLLPDTAMQTLSGLYGGFLQNRKDLRLEAYFLDKRDSTPLAGERGGEVLAVSPPGEAGPFGAPSRASP